MLIGVFRNQLASWNNDQKDTVSAGAMARNISLLISKGGEQ